MCKIIKQMLSAIGIATVVVMSSAVFQHSGAAENETVTATCPHILNGRRLVNAEVYDGRPEELAVLVPLPEDAPKKWDLSDPPFKPEGYFLVCKYKGVEQPRAFSLGTDVKVCNISQPLAVSCPSVTLP